MPSLLGINEAQEIADAAKGELESALDSTRQSIDDLSDQKFQILTGSLTDFVDTFSQIKNVDVGETDLSNYELSEMHNVVVQIKKVHASIISHWTLFGR